MNCNRFYASLLDVESQINYVAVDMSIDGAVKVWLYKDVTLTGQQPKNGLCHAFPLE